MGQHPLQRGRFLQLAGAGGVLAASSLAGEAAAEPAPQKALARVRDLKVGEPVTASYPDADSPVIVLKLGHRVDGGVGPDGDVVAYSSFCTHMGCPVTYHADRKVLACPCHFSSFDPAHGGLQIIGQATTNLPQIVLEARNGEVYGVGIEGLVWGRQDNSLGAVR